jgi:hypothetical protein
VRRRIGVLALVPGAAVAAALLSGCGDDNGPIGQMIASGGKSLVVAQQQAAWTACQAEADKGLKRPGTAQYPAIGTDGLDISTDGHAGYRIDGYVDAENGFGAMNRLTFTCNASPDAEGGYTVTVTDMIDTSNVD